MQNLLKLNPHRAMLLIIDVQKAFVEPIKKSKKVIKKCVILVQAARILGLPIVATEQYPKGLGSTVSDIKMVLGKKQFYPDKTSFSCMGDEKCRNEILKQGRSQVIVAGLESHVCVLQTVLDLLEAGKDVFVLADAVGSRDNEESEYALSRMADSGAIVTTAETVILEMTADSKHPQFKSLQKLIK